MHCAARRRPRLAAAATPWLRGAVSGADGRGGEGAMQGVQQRAWAARRPSRALQSVREPDPTAAASRSSPAGRRSAHMRLSSHVNADIPAAATRNGMRRHAACNTQQRTPWAAQVRVAEPPERRRQARQPRSHRRLCGPTVLARWPHVPPPHDEAAPCRSNPFQSSHRRVAQPITVLMRWNAAERRPPMGVRARLHAAHTAWRL